MELAQHESRRAFLVYGRYLFEYYQLWDTAARHADHPKNLSSESCRMHIWLAQSSLRCAVDFVYPTTNHLCSSRCRFDDPQSQRGALVQDWGEPEMGDVPTGTGYIWKYPCRIMFRSYVSHLQSNYHTWARNRVQRAALAGHLLIGMIQFWSCPVHAWDVDLSRFFVCWLNDWACWKSYTDENGSHTFHSSEYLRCLLYNLVALPYAVPPAFSTPTTCLWAFVSVGSGVQVVLATGPGLAWKNRFVQFQNCPNTRPAASWLSKPGPIPVNSRVSPGWARTVGSTLWFCVSGFSIYGRIQLSYCLLQNIDYGTALSFSDVLTTFI